MRTESWLFGATVAALALAAPLGCNAIFGITEARPFATSGAGGAGVGGSGDGGSEMTGAVSAAAESSATSGSGGAGPSGPCGDGKVTPPEECDPKDPATSPQCTSICTIGLAVDLAAGISHTCVLLHGGQVKCWGFNGNGELGLNEPTDAVGDGPDEMGAKLMPVDLGTGRLATKIASGKSHTCAILEDKTIKCWGLNGAGQLGLGDKLSRGDAPGEMGDALPTVNLGQNAAVTDIAAGTLHTCALFDNGNVKCWGANDHGQVGAGAPSLTNVGDDMDEMGDSLPVLVGGVKSIAAGDFHTCVLYMAGDVVCWGYNSVGQLGVGDTMSTGSAIKALNVELGGAAAEIWAGGNQTCALRTDGVMKCWGDNKSNELGFTGPTAMGDEQAEVGNFPSVSIDAPPSKPWMWSMGEDHTCAIFPGSGVKCWGKNNVGQLGLGQMSAMTLEDPIKCPPSDIGVGKLSLVALGDSHSCVITDLGSVKCWGRNFYGELGLGDTNTRGLNASEMGVSLPTVRLVSDSW